MASFIPENSYKIIHPVCTAESETIPFVHALKLAQMSKGELEIIDLRPFEDEIEKISVRRVLEKWGLLPPGSQRQDVSQLGLGVKKMKKEEKPKKMLKKIAERIDREFHHILVIGTGRNEKGGNIFHKSIGEKLTEHFRKITLFVPISAKPFVNRQTGQTRLEKILVPVAVSPDCTPSMQMVRSLINVFNLHKTEIIGLHVGDGFPPIEPALTEGMNWQTISRSGSVSSEIAKAARETDADLIVMSTNGRDTLSQKLIGSYTERVLGQAPCPVFAVAAD